MNNIIKVELNDKSDYKNKFNNNRISKELHNYIINEIKSANIKDTIVLEIATKFDITEEEKKELISMIKLSYKDDLDELKIFDKKDFTKASIYMSIGILVLLIYYISNNLFFFSEFILIIGWLIIWEAADILLFSRTENKIKQLRRKQLIHSKIIYKKNIK